MRTALTRVMTLLFIALMPCLGQGAEIKKLYEASVIVPDSGQVAFRLGATEALINVLVRVSGRNDINEIKPLMKEADYAYKWVRQFSYQPHVAVDSADGLSEEQGQQLTVVFNSGQVDSLLKKYQQPIWPANRPLVILWLVIDTASGQRLLDATLDHELYQAINDAAYRRGIPIILPQLSLSTVVPFEAISRGDEQAIRQASTGYNADYIIAGGASITSQQRWLGRWFEFYQGNTNQSLIDTFEPKLAINNLIDKVADQLSAQFSIWPGQFNEEGLFIKVSGIDTFAQYHQLESYLDNLKVTSNVKIVAVNGGEVTILLNLITDQLQFFDVLKLDNLLQLQAQAKSQPIIRLGAQESELQTMVKIYPFIWQQSNNPQELQ